MRPLPATADLSGLARMAQSSDPALRSLILEIEAKNFAAAQGRSRALVERFEALASGLIPLVTSDVLAQVARILIRVPDTPPGILKALEERLASIVEAPGRRLRTVPEPHHRAAAGDLAEAAIVEFVAMDEADVDLSLARNTHARLDGWALSHLVDRARTRPELARVLLGRPEPTLFDRASLYRSADAQARSEIRRGFTTGGTTLSGPLPALPQAVRAEILTLAERGDRDGVFDILQRAVGSPAVPVQRLADRIEAELFALALLALGLQAADCVTVLLTIDPRLSRSVAAVFALTEIVRETSRASALEIVACVAGRTRRQLHGRQATADLDHPAFDRMRRTAPVQRALRTSAGPPYGEIRRLVAPSPAASGQLDHRSRATRGLDRS